MNDTRAIESIIEGERNAIANMANTAAYIFHEMTDVNWAGFYLINGSELVLGPFQGNIACIRIAPGRGVCGKAASEHRTIIVPNVHEFDDHIVCDAASNSEIVVPMLLPLSESDNNKNAANNRLLGVLDVDSPLFSRFTSRDAEWLEHIVGVVINGCDW